MMESVRPAAITAAQKTPAPTKEITPVPTVEKTPTPTPTETPAPTVEKKQSASQEKRKTEANDDLPLDRVITDGGFSRIFRTIGVVGDSLSSGAMTYNMADEEAKQKMLPCTNTAGFSIWRDTVVQQHTIFPFQACQPTLFSMRIGVNPPLIC